jgi:CheY-like chemotaxis protein
VRERAHEYGVVAVLGKPFRDEALLAAIRVALDPAGQENA